jgi:hypothetical protein
MTGTVIFAILSCNRTIIWRLQGLILEIPMLTLKVVGGFAVAFDETLPFAEQYKLPQNPRPLLVRKIE